MEVGAGDRPDRAKAFREVAWDDLARTEVRGPVLLRVRAPRESRAIEMPWCAGRGRIWVDGSEVATAPGPRVLPLTSRGAEHEIVVALTVSGYEHRIACGARPRAGSPMEVRAGLGEITFESAHAREGGGHAVVFVPIGHDLTKPAALLVGLHPWNGTPWTYAAYAELLDEARVRDVVLLMPSGLGNSLYTADAEAEVLGAMTALGRVLSVDPARVSLWGASMGGAGATTIGFHHPDRFATVTSFFGDSKYDLSTYVHGILHDEAGAHRVNALDVAGNATYLPVWLVHGERDTTSPIRQSEMLARALESRGSPVHFDRVPDAGHEGALVARFARALVDRAAEARSPGVVPRVAYTSVHSLDDEAYGVRLVRDRPDGDASVVVDKRSDGVHVLSASGVRSIALARGALGVSPAETPSIVRESGVAATVSWDEGGGASRSTGR